MASESLSDRIATVLQQRLADNAGSQDEAHAWLRYHGLVPLFQESLGTDALRVEVRALAMWELAHCKVIRDVLSTFADRRIPVIVMKGTATAYDVYDSPWHRPRGDTDLLVESHHVAQVREILLEQGFEPFYETELEPLKLRTQEPWTNTQDNGAIHQIDLHWQAFNGPTLANVIPVREAINGAVPLPRLDRSAFALSRPFGLLHSCLHRTIHIHSPYFIGDDAHYGGDRLIWLIDIDLLARAMSDKDWTVFRDRAVQCGGGDICCESLGDATAVFGTPVPPDVMSALAAAPGGRVSAYLRAPTARARALMDLRAGGWRYGLYRLVPPPELIRARYPGSRLPMPILYLRRLFEILTGRRQ